MKHNYSLLKFTDRKDIAVSEAIGFLLIFSLVMVGIGLVTLYGYPMLLETQSNANVRNMERDMIVIQNDMKSLVYKNVPYKETSLQVSGGALAVYNYSMKISEFIITTTDSNTNSNLSLLSLDSVKCGQLIYESDKGESIIALENGAVLTRMEFQQGSAMLAEPRWFVDKINRIDGSGINQTLIITLISLQANSVMSRNGIGTVKMTLDNDNSIYYQSDYISDPGMTVNVGYIKDSEKFNFTRAWETYFVNSLDMNPTSPPSLTNVNTLVVKKYTINIESL